MKNRKFPARNLSRLYSKEETINVLPCGLYKR
jgi:hypothetical protein